MNKYGFRMGSHKAKEIYANDKTKQKVRFY
jgi:hypothetical protein